MSNTLVVQSHRHPLPFPWIQTCLDSVSQWADRNHFDYQFIGDELFDSVSKDLLQKTTRQMVIATDLARLYLLQNGLQRGYQTVIWCDADFLIFNPNQFVLPETAYALGREVWIQLNAKNQLKAYSKVHNAFLMFRQGNTFLDFYADTAERLLRQNSGQMPPQFIGPKLLTALHNIVNCPVFESAGMLSPMVMRDLVSGQGLALDLFRNNSSDPIYAANLSSSLTRQNSISDADMKQLIQVLINELEI